MNKNLVYVKAQDTDLAARFAAVKNGAVVRSTKPAERAHP